MSYLGRVRGQGLNDIKQDVYKIYFIKRLDFNKQVFLERIIQNNDMELDDFIISKKFGIKQIPGNWKYLTRHSCKYKYKN